MPQPNTALNLDDLFAAIETRIAAAMPEFALVAAYPADRRNLPLPACVIELVELEAVDNPGTEQLAVSAHFQARVVLGFREQDAKRRVAKAAATLGHFVQGQRWGLPVEPATIEMIMPDEFEPERDQFEVWAVEWHQTVHIGASIWEDDGTPPTTVLASWAPEVGPAHEGEYRDIGEATA